MRIDMCMDMCMDTCMDMRMNMSTAVSKDASIAMWMHPSMNLWRVMRIVARGHVCNHACVEGRVYRHARKRLEGKKNTCAQSCVYRRVHRHLYRHAGSYMCRLEQTWPH